MANSPGHLDVPSLRLFSIIVGVLYSLGGKRTFSTPDSLPQLTTAAGIYSYLYHWTWGGGVTAVVPGNISVP
jgi:hypothetical protein